MITVDLQDGKLKLSFKYYQDYINRVKQIGAKFIFSEKSWILDVENINKLNETFKGELYYRTPEWEITGATPPDYSKLYEFKSNINVDSLGFKLPPYNYQKFGIKFLIDRLEEEKVAFIGDDVGIGKTAQAIGTIKHFMSNVSRETFKVIIVCKKSIKEQWKEEIERFIDLDAKVLVALDGKKRFKTYEEYISEDRGILIVNYHLLLNDSKLLKADYVIFDEVHTAKAYKKKINRACNEITKNADMCLFMTGTPIMSKIEDLYGILSIKDEKYLGKYSDFKKKHIIEHYNGNYSQVVGYKNLDELREKVQRIILRRTANEVSIDLPEVVEMKKLCNKDSLQLLCEEICKEKIDEVQTKIEALTSKYKFEKDNEKKQTIFLEIQKSKESMKGFIAVRQAIANSASLLKESKSPMIRKMYESVNIPKDYQSGKMEQILDIIDSIVEADKKCIVFTKYETMVNFLSKHLSSLKINNVSYSGSLNDETRNANLKTFKTDPECKVIIGSDALAEGVNLNMADTVINIDLPFDFAIYNQRVGRSRRAGSNHKTTFVYNMITEDSIDEQIYDKVINTKNTFDAFISVNSEQSKILKELNN